MKPSIRSNELADLERARRSCWMQGFDLDFIEEIFPSCKPFERESVGPCENLAVMWNEIPHEEVQAWSTKRGRINYWLLQNLIASSKESKRHRSYLQNGEDIDETLWPQLVLLFSSQTRRPSVSNQVLVL